jgi:hypothetical protein
MAQSVRSRNLDLLRWLYGTHKAMSKKLSRIANPAYLSEMATNKRQIGNGTAREIEETLDLPVGWMDRDNVALLLMPTVDSQIHTAIADCSEPAKAGLLQFLRPPA